MNLIRRSAWAVVMLGAVSGCGDDQSTATSNPPASNLPPAPAKPVVPPSGGAGADKVGTSKEMQPAPATAGEGKKADESPKLEGPKSETGKGDTAAVKLSADEIAAIKQLPAGEQEVALKQAVCPVSGHNLGSMDKPVKVSAVGRTFYLCCEDCEKEVKSNPKGVIAKLDARTGKK
jgi:YHS domain-containing protein